MSIELGSPVGHLVNGALVKNIKPANVLRLPEKSFTVDKQVYDKWRAYIKKVVVNLENDYYELSAEEFDKIKIPYNYGNGYSYRVAIKHWHKITEQGRLI